MVGPVVRELSRIRDPLPLIPVAIEWLAVAGTFAFAVWLDAWWAYLLAVVVLGGRQQALTVLMHEAAHYRLASARRWNDHLGDLLCALPVGLSLARYRHVHLLHHRNLNGPQDPDLQSMDGNPQYHFPMSRKRFLLVLLGDLLGMGFRNAWRNARAYHPFGPGLGWRSWLLRGGRTTYPVLGTADRLRALAAVGAATAIVVLLPFEVAWKCAALWVVAYSTTFPLFLRLRSVAEHRGCADEHELNAIRHVDARWWERLLICPWRINYHIAHHIFPSVPQYRLPRLQRFLLTLPEFREHAHVTRGYGLKGLVGEITSPGAHAPDR